MERPNVRQVLDCAGKAQRRRRFRVGVTQRLTNLFPQSGVALRLPPQSKTLPRCARFLQFMRRVLVAVSQMYPFIAPAHASGRYLASGKPFSKSSRKYFDEAVDDSPSPGGEGRGEDERQNNF